VLSTETYGARLRGPAGLASQVFWVLGECMLALLAWWLRPWRSLTVALGVASAATAALAHVAAPESPRWLLVQGRRAEAREALQWFARRNGTNVPAGWPAAEAVPAAAAAEAGGSGGRKGGDGKGAGDAGGGGVLVDSAASATAGEAAGGGGGNGAAAVNATGILAVLRHPVARSRLLCVSALMAALGFAYFGVSLALEGLSGSLHLNFLLTSLSELPAYALSAAAINRAGRRATTLAGLGAAGAACVACAFTAGGLQVGMSAVGKLGASASWATAVVLGAELFPTAVRSAAMAATTQASRIGSIVAPTAVLLGTLLRSDAAPFLALGGVALLGVAATLALPETRGMPQAETLAELPASGCGCAAGGDGAAAAGPAAAAAAAAAAVPDGAPRRRRGGALSRSSSGGSLMPAGTPQSCGSEEGAPPAGAGRGLPLGGGAAAAAACRGKECV